MNYLLHIAIMLGIYGMLALATNLLIGFGGLLTMAQAAFYGLGAYAYALLTTKLGLPFVVTLPAAIAICAFVGWLFGLIALRFRNEAFVLATIGFQMIVYVVLYNWTDLTRGPYGISGIPRPAFFGFGIESVSAYFVFTLGLFALVFGFMHLVCRSPFALSLKALRDDEAAAQTLGICPKAQYTRAMVISAAVAAVPGVVFASYITYIDPTSFTLSESIFVACILLVGGSGNLKGPMTGVLFMILLPEVLRFVGLPDAVAANLREIIYGVLLIVIVYMKPKGLAGAYAIK
ncbi:MAG: branched-chain amino acid ABC transporter permease [Kiritimatiellae bacterium]|nr:branched-chain amino acid ABC transporter permease [Kiritimatiellia bacterium]